VTKVRERVIKDVKVDPKARAESERKQAMAEATAALSNGTLRASRRGGTSMKALNNQIVLAAARGPGGQLGQHHPREPGDRA
jgi:ribosome-associated translation inhibitor RaiA